MAGDEGRTLPLAEFIAELVTVTRGRPATTHLYLSLEPAGQIWVQWEQPGTDHSRRFRVTGPTGVACPHCVIIEGVERLAPVLPIDVRRTVRARHQYETVLRTRRLPSMALGRQSGHPAVTWLVDCHAAVGDPHTDADCDAHRDPDRSAGAAADGAPADPLTTVDPLPRLLVQRYASAAAAAHDISVRMSAARDWRDTAEEVARGHPEAEAPWAFLRERCVLGVPVAFVPGAVYGLRPGHPPDERSPRHALLAVVERLRDGRRADRYQDDACLVPLPGETRLPSYAGAVDIATTEPARTLRLPMTPHPLSRLGRGILLLFEARHAMHTRSVPVSPGHVSDWVSEAALHVFEFDLLARFNGYQQAVETFRERLDRAGDLLDRPRKVLNRGQRRALAEPFGRIDDEELHLWASVAYRNAIFITLGRDLGAFAMHLQAQAG
jgi:hypothetical protein